MQNPLDKDYHIFSLFRYTVPSILSILFMSLYMMVDSIFVANFVSENALAAINITYPVISVILAITLMFSSGGSAIVARKLGERKNRAAKEDFTCLILATVLTSAVISVLSLIFLEPLLNFLGATPALWQDCEDYLKILLPAFPIATLQPSLCTFLVTAGKPNYSFILTLLSGITNIVLDYILIVIYPLGISGAAIGTTVGYLVAAIPAALYFFFQRKGTIYFVHPKIRLRMLSFACYNGSSEMITNLAVSVTTLLFNKLTLFYMGEAGVAAITIILYAQFLLTAVFMGFIGGAAPIFSFNYGSHNMERISSLFRSSLTIVILLTALMMIVAYAWAKPIIGVYIRPDSNLFPLALHGFLIFSVSYLFTGINIYTSGLFTALQNGKISAIVSGLRTFVFLVICLFVLPALMGPDGIWLAVPVAEGLSFLFAVGFLIYYRNQYHFFLRKH